MSLAITFVVLACLVASGAIDVVPPPPAGVLPTASDAGAPPPSSSPSSSPRREREERATRALAEADHLEGEDGSCHLAVETERIALSETIVGQGILFALRSNATDDDGLTITSLGFFVDSDRVQRARVLEYEVYALKEEGYYAAPERNAAIPSQIRADAPVAFDYRGEQHLDAWDLVGAGNLTAADLRVDRGVVDARLPPPREFFRIPFGRFAPTRVPARGRLRSFYVATKAPGLVYTAPRPTTPVADGSDVNRGMTLQAGAGMPPDGAHAPQLLVGEGISSYPMMDLYLYYQAKSFLGKVYYRKDCASLAPSASAQPSGQPNAPSQLPTTQPSRVSTQPSSVPSAIPSTAPPTAFTIKVSTSSLVQFPLACTPGASIPIEESAAVAAAVKVVVTKMGVRSTPRIYYVNTMLIEAICIVRRRRQLAPKAANELVGVERRRLPSGSNTGMFFFIVTGEYSPEADACRRLNPPCKDDPNFGKIVASINSDQRTRRSFVEEIKKESKERGLASKFSEIEEDNFEVQTFEAIAEKVSVKFPRIPTTMPTPAVTNHSFCARLSPLVWALITSHLYVCVFL